MRLAQFAITSLAVLAPLTSASVAIGQTHAPRDEQVWQSWQLFLRECGAIIEDHDAYISGASGAAGALSVEVTPDGHVTALSKAIADGYVESFVHRFADRVLIHCSYFHEHSDMVDDQAVTGAFINRMSSETDFQIIGGHAPLYTEENFMAVLGAWPDADDISRIRFGAYEAQFHITHTQMLDAN